MCCRGLHVLANPAYLSGFLCSALPCVAPYCVPGGIRVVSTHRGSGKLCRLITRTPSSQFPQSHFSAHRMDSQLDEHTPGALNHARGRLRMRGYPITKCVVDTLALYCEGNLGANGQPRRSGHLRLPYW